MEFSWYLNQTVSTANVVWHQVIVWEGDVKNDLGDRSIGYLKLLSFTTNRSRRSGHLLTVGLHLFICITRCQEEEGCINALLLLFFKKKHCLHL